MVRKMINSFFGKLIYKNNNDIYLQNVNGCCELYYEKNSDLKIGDDYFFYYFDYKINNSKGLCIHSKIAFINLIEAINFKELININGIGIKTALKIINSGVKDFKLVAINEDIDYIAKNFNISELIAKNIIKHYQNKEINSINENESIKLNNAINNLEKLGYKKDLVKKIVLNRKKEIIEHQFNEIFSMLIMDIKNERNKLKTK